MVRLESSHGFNPLITTDTLTKNMSVATTSSSPVTQPRSDTISPITSEAVPSYKQSCCTLVSAFTNENICHPRQPGIDNSTVLASEVISALLDDNPITCMRPFQLHTQLSLALDTLETQGSSLIHIKVTGERLDCTQPSTMVFMDMTMNPETLSNNANKQECPFVGSNGSENQVTCTYECRPHVPCDGSLRFGLQVQRLSWLARSQQLDQLCDIRTDIYWFRFEDENIRGKTVYLCHHSE